MGDDRRQIGRMRKRCQKDEEIVSAESGEAVSKQSISVFVNPYGLLSRQSLARHHTGPRVETHALDAAPPIVSLGLNPAHSA